ncbi:MAG: bifunctional [glutamate--ammonia ligase]-adenylyl-L-tyrosine phosphorylase/[glutamate--ammonia-ligase] adenylyltransferase [Planctomycetota bacterium]|nr:MAG: bifunctional [glutamate--ammonia ligase]-adenylyl-L-tyrosine phosphorylase/[glutamate--ammonia-ligase] adenylyltransferase [Planctomycetota bacterium]
MDLSTISALLDDPALAEARLRPMGVCEPSRVHEFLVRIADAGVTLDLVADLLGQFAVHLPRISDADMALNNLDRFFAAARSPLSLAALFERDRQALPILLQIFSTSQHLSDLLVTDGESYDLLRMTEGQPVARDVLVAEIVAETLAQADEKAAMATLRRFKRRETLRIAYGDIVLAQDLLVVTEQISFLADAIVEAALRAAERKVNESRGVPRLPDGRAARFVVLALGKLGGVELNYSSDIDLIFLYDGDGTTDGRRRQSSTEYFDALARELIRLLTETNEHGIAYRVDMRLRPEGDRGPLVPSLESALHYYDVLGRTWERQAMVKARAIAGDLDLGREFLAQLEPWVFRRYLSRADISGIRALKRRIEQRAQREGADHRDVKTGHGGIRDIEFVIQFLQLLNGGELPELRTGNTLVALDRLERAGCLNDRERTELEENYRFLRKIEHRLQIMFDLQTHAMPEDDEELRKLAVRMGFDAASGSSAREAFLAEYRRRTGVNRIILNHLLHLAFGDEGEVEPEVDLVLDPDPPRESIRQTLSKYRFQSVDNAYDTLMSLATERIPFLSTRRCRHFLAAIAPRLLAAVSQTPDPDSTLVNLANVSDSLGGKGVLWELFSFSPPTMRLYVELCSSSPFLSEILTSNPGMIDELLDSLLLDRLPKPEQLRAKLADLCRGAEDIEPILHSFKNTEQLSVGVRDILGKEDIKATNAALADIAQVCLEQLTRREFDRLGEKFGIPWIAETIPNDAELSNGAEPLEVRTPETRIPNPESRRCEFVTLALGKYGGREPNYHSDLDVIFLYEADGQTRPLRPNRKFNETSNQHFFGELGQRIIKSASQLGPYGRLYEVDARLRPTGRSGALATSLAELVRYFDEGEGQLWERLALCKARVVYGEPAAAARAMEAVWHVAYGRAWQAADAEEIYQMRMRLEETANPRNIKRGAGGIVDIEFLVQMLQLRHGGMPLSIRAPGTLDAIDALCDAGCLARGDAEFLSKSYRFLRNVEARIRLMNAAARHDMPDEELDLAKLARLLHYSRCEDLLADDARIRREVREVFNRHFQAESREPSIASAR